jgi:hypothetical protein
MLTRKLEALPDPSAFLISFSLRFFVIGAGYTVNGIWGGSRISSLSTQALAFWSFWNLGHANVAEGSAKSLDLSGQHTSADPSLFWNSTTYPATHTDPKKGKIHLIRACLLGFCFSWFKSLWLSAWYTTTWQLGRNVWLSLCPFSGKGT